MLVDDEHLWLRAQWAADCLLRPESELQLGRADTVRWILEDPMNVRELLTAAALDLALRFIHRRDSE